MSGDEGFAGWARAVTPGLLRLAALSGGGDPGAGADDVVQDVLVEVLARWSRLSRLEHLDAYAAGASAEQAARAWPTNISPAPRRPARAGRCGG